MRIAHVTNFDEPTISPFFRICLKLVENRCLSDGGECVQKIVRPHLRYLGSFVFPGLFCDLCQRYYGVCQWSFM